MARKGESKTGGRQPGTPNRSTAAIKEMAGKYSEKVIKELARLAIHGINEPTRVSACRELLDRACGKPAQNREPIDDHRVADEEVSDLEIGRRVAWLLSKAVDESKLKNQ